jgi:hypothetical protein
MDVFNPFLQVLLRSAVVLFPMTVGLLAFRRLALSKSSNAWIYAMMCLFAAVTAAGVLPWTLGLTSLNWLLTLMAFACPAMWIGVILACDLSRTHRYGPDPVLRLVRLFQPKTEDRFSKLSLDATRKVTRQPVVFKHETKRRKIAARPRSQSTTTLLSLARDIRGNTSSDRRRPKLLPAPDTDDLPFLSRSRGA